MFVREIYSGKKYYKNGSRETIDKKVEKGIVVVRPEKRGQHLEYSTLYRDVEEAYKVLIKEIPYVNITFPKQEGIIPKPNGSVIKYKPLSWLLRREFKKEILSFESRNNYIARHTLS